jgi:hypothetical protein
VPQPFNATDMPPIDELFQELGKLSQHQLQTSPDELGGPKTGY